MATKQTSDNSLLYDMMKKEEALEKKERLNKKVEALNKELNEIAERAYQAAISAKVEEYQQQANNPELTAEELRAIEEERKDFEANPAKYGMERTKSPIVDKSDQRRAMQIVELLKDPSKINDTGDMNTGQFVNYMQGFAERNKPKDV